MDKAEFLKSKGWFQWYNPLYWCHLQFNSEQKDCTNWGMSLDEAYKFEADQEAKKRIIKGMNLVFNGQQILSKLGTRNNSGK